MVVLIIAQLIKYTECNRRLENVVKNHVIDYDPYDADTQEYVERLNQVKELFNAHREGK